MAADTGGVGVSDPGLLGNPSSLRVDTVRGLSGAHDNEPNVHYWPNPADFVRCTNVVSLLRYFGRTAHVICTAVGDPERTSAKRHRPQWRSTCSPWGASAVLTIAPHPELMEWTGPFVMIPALVGLVGVARRSAWGRGLSAPAVGPQVVLFTIQLRREWGHLHGGEWILVAWIALAAVPLLLVFVTPTIDSRHAAELMPLAFSAQKSGLSAVGTEACFPRSRGSQALGFSAQTNSRH
jgi:hypothetical protein